MKLLKNKWALLSLNLAVGLAFFLITAPALQLKHMINILFYFGACWLFVGIFLWTVHGGFFDGVVYGFRKSFERSFKRNDYLSENDTVPSEKVSISFVKAACFQGFCLLVLMLILLTRFYAA
ncbi:DUF3899 domain-containing protein [Sediminibacillus halophilus]|uniref:DUF3899 domain-containing protein n=1 Tax=Sediminibacillus halophilus TaxID=482461 RepID=A0A1G9PHS3_9BACI|nr:DUF3899 domain-containing protein [Sediminibacillus halophilus]SDL98289.1 protein of unknown function [Sediminibacillus halophilus]